MTICYRRRADARRTPGRQDHKGGDQGSDNERQHVADHGDAKDSLMVRLVPVLLLSLTLLFLSARVLREHGRHQYVDIFMSRPNRQGGGGTA